MTQPSPLAAARSARDWFAGRAKQFRCRDAIEQAIASSPDWLKTEPPMRRLTHGAVNEAVEVEEAQQQPVGIGCKPSKVPKRVTGQRIESSCEALAAPVPLRSRQDDGGDCDADLDLADPGQHGIQRQVRVVDDIAGDDRCRIAGKLRAVRGEEREPMAQKAAHGAPACQAKAETDTVLRECRPEQDRGSPSGQCAIRAEQRLAQRRTEHGLAHDGGRGARPVGVVEFQPEGEAKRDADRGRRAQAVQQRRLPRRRIAADLAEDPDCA